MARLANRGTEESEMGWVTKAPPLEGPGELHEPRVHYEERGKSRIALVNAACAQDHVHTEFRQRSVSTSGAGECHLNPSDASLRFATGINFPHAVTKSIVSSRELGRIGSSTIVAAGGRIGDRMVASRLTTASFRPAIARTPVANDVSGGPMRGNPAESLGGGIRQ
ncbi:hypothetical protein M427DRAFT_43959 [Gonapodya prolifera JEL478]|uniref:Uncharacterized protein n=1 Tax=Gonapodya prolifera (strain JEL478) TaxID=1344416 RepID=A0A139AH90_GONPJ|nr:hypothetical protein M427DRAFT_43959 [Gonapodya prolifera JEL478]|eukprot:KXS16157.1 hypothetical protein M427DRAFT_43959 [Gonapodya prolifera JEL478]